MNPGERSLEVDLVKQRVDIAEVVREVVGDLEPRGEDLWACCPFHDEATPSFHVVPRRRMFKCFGCGVGGDVISFVMRSRGLPFREALELLAARAGVELASLSPEEKRRAQQARRSRAVLEVALEQFRRALLESPGNPALRYMRARGFGDETLQRFDIGLIPADFLARLRSARLDQAAVDGAGFTSAFGGRVGFGIRDASGGLVGFGARRLDDEAAHKYVNTRETPWFSKGRLLYGLDKAARTLARTRRLVVMEGYTDVMMAHQQGLDEAVATMGTAFTSEHLRLVKARVSDLVLVFDSDNAGRLAAERTVRMVLAEGLECRVLHVPEGKDPCDWFASRGREDFDRLLAQHGQSSVEYLCRRALERCDPRQPGVREEVARDVLRQTSALQDPLRRETIVADVARACDLGRAVLARRAGGGVVAPPRQVRVGAPSGPLRALDRSQLQAVAGLVDDPLRLTVLRDLRAQGALPLAAAAGLLSLAEELLAAHPGGLDGEEWLTAAAGRDAAWREALDRALFAPPGSVTGTWEEAVQHLRRHAAEEQARARRREALARVGPAGDPEALREMQQLLRRPAPARQSREEPA
jgi:DNA primase catalytic core